LERAEKGWQHSKIDSDDMYVDSVALNLHGFYSGLERLFELIATVVDERKPQGAERNVSIGLVQLFSEFTEAALRRHLLVWAD
jgi:hypothetical protein